MSLLLRAILVAGLVLQGCGQEEAAAPAEAPAAAAPEQQRNHLGWIVLLFLAVLLVLTYKLKKAYWKDIH